VVLRKGRIAEIGTHRDLMAKEGYYASLVRRQRRQMLTGDANVPFAANAERPLRVSRG
jgi:hypothetical protein